MARAKYSVAALENRGQDATMDSMSACGRNNRFIHTLLLLLLIVSVTGAMLNCIRSEIRPDAAFCDTQEAPAETPMTAAREPVMASSYTDDANEADPDTGLAAMHTVQLRLLSLGRESGQKRYQAVWAVILLLFAAAADCPFRLRRHCRHLSRLILRRRAIIIYIYSQDGAKA